MRMRARARRSGSPRRRRLGGCELSRPAATNVVNGKQLFVAKCGACHMLARAGTKGVVGPNLDEAFQRARRTASTGRTFEGIVHRQILHPQPSRRSTRRPARTAADAGQARHGRGRRRTSPPTSASRPPSGARTRARSRTVGGGQGRGHRQGEGRQARHPGRPGRRARLQVRRRRRRTPGQLDDRVARTTQSIDHNIAIEGNGVDEKGQVVKDGGDVEGPGRPQARRRTRSTARCPATARAAWRASSPSSERRAAPRLARALVGASASRRARRRSTSAATMMHDVERDHHPAGGLLVGERGEPVARSPAP